MGKFLLAIWLFLGSLFGVNHQWPAQYSPKPTTTPTVQPTLAPNQVKAIYTFYIKATSHKISAKGLSLKQSDTGKVFTVDIGTFISLDFGSGKFRVSLSSPQDIFKCVGSECLPHSSPRNSISSFWVSRTGSGTIQAIETK